MSRIKKISYGQIGNEYPDHSDRSNPNSQGLDSDGLPGVELYIEEDVVVANTDNRPLRNLIENDGILANNASDVASEIDRGVFKDKYNEFNLSILPMDNYTDPENDEDEILINKLKIDSGSSIVNGKVIRLGNQQLSFFYRKDDSDSILFFQPELLDEEIPVIHDVNYWGDYTPVYTTISEDLPDDFENQQIQIINEDTLNPEDPQTPRTSTFYVYRDSEDIIPFKAESTTINNEVVDFEYDLNYGQDSDGYWLDCGGTINTRVTDVVISKNITVQDKLFEASEFTEVEGRYETPIVTDGLFFKNTQWGDLTEFNRHEDIQDMYVDAENNIYFIQRSGTNKNLFRLQNSSIQLETKSLRATPDTTVNLGLFRVQDYLIIYGSDGFIKLHDLTSVSFSAAPNVSLSSFSTSQDINDIYVWDNKIWIAGDTLLWYTDYETFDPTTSTFTSINLGTFIKDSEGTTIIEKTNKLLKVRGNYLTTGSAYIFNIDNLAPNSSFEKGGLNVLPTDWHLIEDASGSSFVVSNTAPYRQNYCGKFTKSAFSSYCTTYADIEYNDASSYTFSIYGKAPISDQSILIKIEELDGSDVLIDSSESTITFTNAWQRFNVSHTISSSTTAATIRISIRSTAPDTESIYLDDAQLESGSTLHDYTENFEYLFIGFKKISSPLDTANPPFAVIDINDKYVVKYSQNKYGEIQSVNDAVEDGANSIYFVEDRKIRYLTFLNNLNEYNRFSIRDVYPSDIDYSHNNIYKYESIKKFGDKIYYGGIVDNRVIKIEANTTGEHDIKFEAVGSGEELMTLLGGITQINATALQNASAQFNRIDKLHESLPAGLTELGLYKPATAYGVKVTLDGESNTLSITSPDTNESPWTVNDIFTALKDVFENISENPNPIDISWVDMVNTVTSDYPIWEYITSSIIEKDGFYSTNGQNEFAYIRGNIHKIFIQENNTEYFYLVCGNQIYKTKNDPNLLKQNEDYIAYNWTLINSDYILENQRTIVNQQLIFSDEPTNRSYLNLPVDEGYNVLNGSLRIKTNQSSEIGFSEDVDYFVDYENNRVIRNDNTNFLLNPEFDLLDGGDIASWGKSDVDDTFIRSNVDSKFTDHAAKLYMDSGSTEAIAYQKVSATVLNNNATMTLNEEWIFSIYLQSSSLKESVIRLVEYNAGNENSFDDGNFASGHISSTAYSVGGTGNENEWVRFTVNHIVQSAASTGLRVEVHTDSTVQILLTKAQLEQNATATPYVKETTTSRIDPDMSVWVDFIEYKQLTSSTDYIFDTSERKLKLIVEPTSLDIYYLKYKYNKIFNPYTYGDSLPTITAIPDDNDDYFLFEGEGKIWAINQIFALLSLDTTDPIYVSYNYHYPRIDSLKIRNVPDKYGNYLYVVKGDVHPNNPYKPIDAGLGTNKYVLGSDYDDITDYTDSTQYNDDDNETLYEICVTSNNYTKNDFYDRRIYIDTKDHTPFNISLFPETLAYFPFINDFNSTNGIMPLNLLEKSKIIPIIKNYDIIQNSEVGAWHEGYQLVLRDKSEMQLPGTAETIFVDPFSGNDTNTGSQVSPYKTVAKAVSEIKALAGVGTIKPNIRIINTSTLNEDIEINLPELGATPLKVFADTYCYWQGGLQNLTPVYVEGIWFQNANIYPYGVLYFYFCTLENTAVNCLYPQVVKFYNCEALNCHNSIIRVKDVLFPSPFHHPYELFPLRDLDHDGIVDNDTESIAPGDIYYDSSLTEQPVGEYLFDRCLIHDTTDSLIHYDPSFEWTSTFAFNYCTIAHNYNLFETEQYGLDISYNDCILFANSETKDSGTKIFNSNSDIRFDTCFIDFDDVSSSSVYNFGSGALLNRGLCIGRSTDADPAFIGIVDSAYDYHLQSVARGSAIDSDCLDAGPQGDLGCYNESREQKIKTIPKKLRQYVAYIEEGIVYPIKINSEKITITLEFKPTSSVNQPGIILDSRAASDEEDYFVLIYNNNDDNNHSLIQDPYNPLDNPYRFRVIVKNAEKTYSIISPIKITNDEDFKKWHKITFTINYEDIFNNKTSFADKDTAQNIITLYHNDAIMIESFVKYDLNRYVDGDLIYDNGQTNKWNYNDICQFITLGSDYDNQNKMIGYYAELRIDNRFIDRKQFELWNAKVVPFNDPLSYVNQAPLARTIDPRILNEYWSLKSTASIGAKGHDFNSGTSKRIGYEDGEIAWELLKSTDNLFEKSGFVSLSNAQVIGDVVDWSTPKTFIGIWKIITQNTRFTNDNTNGILIDMDGVTVSSRSQFASILNNKISVIRDSEVTPRTYIDFEFTQTGQVRFFTRDIGEFSASPGITVIFDAFTKEIADITCPVGTSLGGTYWNINALELSSDPEVAPTEVNYYVWYNTGSSTDPAPGGRTGIEVSVLTSDTANQVATKTLTALENINAFTGTVDTATITLTNIVGGAVADAANVTAGVSVTVTTQGATNPTGTTSEGEKLGFVGSNTGSRSISSWEFSGITGANISNNNIIFTDDIDYTFLSNNVATVVKNDVLSDSIGIYQEVTVLTTSTYTFSSYIYSNEPLTNDNVKFYDTTAEINFDTIEHYFGKWWICKKSITPATAVHSYGVSFLGEGVYYFNAAQLEEKSYATPYVETETTSDGVLVIDNTILNKDSGVIFFKFKPYFNFTDTTERCLMEVVDKASYDSESPIELVYGFRVSYYFDTVRNRGIVKFNINNLDQSVGKWEVEAIASCWDQWHTIALGYDFNINRFICRYDYYSNVIDESLSNNYNYSDLYVGHGHSLVPGRTWEIETADIAVKNIIITNYPITDSEMLHWMNTYEFYNESSLINIIDKYRDEVSTVINATDNYVDITNNVLTELESLQSNVSAVENELTDLDDRVTQLENDVDTLQASEITQDGRLTAAESAIDTLESSMTTAQGDISTLETDLGNLETTVSNEVASRIAADLSIRNDLASTALNKGASLVGIHDVDSRYTATTTEDALQEIAGTGRTTQTVKGNADSIALLDTSISNINNEFDYVEDGNTGSWTPTLSTDDGYNIYDIKVQQNNDNDTLRLNSNLANGLVINGDCESGTPSLSSEAPYYSDLTNGTFDITGSLYYQNGYSAVLNKTSTGSVTSVALTGDTSATNLNGFTPGMTYGIEAALYSTADSISDKAYKTISQYVSGAWEEVIRLQPSSLTTWELLTTSFTINSLATAVKPEMFISADQPDDTKLHIDCLSIYPKSKTTIDNSISVKRQIEIINESVVIGLEADLASTDVGKGASMIGINDAGSRFTSTTVENSLQELAGSGRTTETVKQNANDIVSLDGRMDTAETMISANDSAISAQTTVINQLKDGSDGSTWTDTDWNLVAHEVRLDTAEGNISTNSATISSHGSSISSLTTGLSDEITNRSNADTAIVNNLASTSSGEGASLVGIYDSADNFTSTNVEGALAELSTLVATLGGQLFWKDPVATYDDLPITGNTVGDARTVNDVMAQYICIATTGARADQWQKIADINWGNASSISFTSSYPEITSTNVSDALDEVYSKIKVQDEFTQVVTDAEWTSDVDGYYITITHNLSSTNISVAAIYYPSGAQTILFPDEVEIVDENNVTIWISDAMTGDVDVHIFAVTDRYSISTNDWTVSGDRYYVEFDSELEDITFGGISVFDVTTKSMIGVDDIVLTSLPTIRIYSSVNTSTVNIFVCQKPQITMTKYIQNWTLESGSYKSDIYIGTGFDAIYTFYDPSTSMQIMVDEVVISGGMMTIIKSDNTPIRMVVLQ